MFFHILASSLRRGRERRALAVLAIAFGTSVATALFSLSLDVGDKVAKELRSYGANLSVGPENALLEGALVAEGFAAGPGEVGGDAGAGGMAPSAGGRALSSLPAATLPAAALPKLRSIFWRHNIEAFVPLLETSARVAVPAEGGGSRLRTIPLVGAWFEHEIVEEDGTVFTTGARQMLPWWKVDGRWIAGPADSLRAMAGRRLAETLGLRPGSPVTLEAPGGEAARVAEEGGESNAGGTRARRVTLEVAGIVETGGEEEDRLYVPLGTAQGLAGLPGSYTRLLVSALTTPENELARKDPKTMTPEEYDRWYCTPYLSTISHQIEETLPGSRAEAILEVAATEGETLRKIQFTLLLITIAALVAAALGVTSSLVTMVLRRMHEVGLMKAIGASDGSILTLFISEAAVLGLLGGVLGYGLGMVFAQVIARSTFGSGLGWSPLVLVLALLVATLVAVAGSIYPIRLALGFEPREVLHRT